MIGHESTGLPPAGRLPTSSAPTGQFASDAVELTYQPVMDLLTGSVLALEAQVEWRRPGGPPLRGAALVLYAERYGLVGHLGDLTALRVVGDLGRSRERGWDPAVTLPVSALQVSTPGFADFLLDQLVRKRVPARRLTVEVSVNALAAHPSATRSALWRLCTAGVGVQLSDLGVAPGVEALLRVAPLTGIKIDRFLISQLPGSLQAERTVAGILAAAATLSLDTVVSGVDTVDQLRLLRRLGCSRATGRLWSAPQPLGEALRLTGPPRPRTVT